MYRPSASSAFLALGVAAFGRTAFTGCALVAFSGCALVAFTGCVDKGRRMGEHESLQYRTQLVRKYHRELSPRQQRDLMYHPGRTQSQIDRTVLEYRQSFQEQQARDAADALESRRRADSQVDDLRRISDTASASEGSAGAGSGVESGSGESGASVSSPVPVDGAGGVDDKGGS